MNRRPSRAANRVGERIKRVTDQPLEARIMRRHLQRCVDEHAPLALRVIRRARDDVLEIRAYCLSRGQVLAASNPIGDAPFDVMIKLHKAKLASDRMSYHSAIANQVRLVFHTAAFWLIHGVRSVIPQTDPLARVSSRPSDATRSSSRWLRNAS
jgi:Transposase DDE domain group 1